MSSDKDDVPFSAENPESSEKSGVFFEADGALEHYLKQLAHLEPVSFEEEQIIWKNIQKLQDEFRRKTFSFGAVYEQVRSLLDSCVEPSDFDEIFPASSIRSVEPNELMSRAAALSKRLGELHNLLRDSFVRHDAKARERAQKEGSGLVSSMPLLIEYAFSFYEEMKRHVCPPEKDPDGEIGAETEKYLAEELFCTKEEFLRVFSALTFIYEQLNVQRRKIAEGNLRLVVSIAKRFHGRGVPFMDLIQEGNVGLMKAIDRFDFPMGHHFSTYATWWIRQCVFHAVGRQSRVIRLPVHMLNTISKINKMEQKLLQETGQEPSSADIAARLDMSPERVNSLKRMAVQPISLQASIYRSDDGEDTLLEDSRELASNQTPVQDLASKNLAQKLSETIASLPPRHAAILRMRYGLEGEPKRSITEISERFRITGERIRQIEASAIAKLRAPSNIKLFEDYFS